MRVAEVKAGEGVEAGLLPQLIDLFVSAWWTADRTEDVAGMLAASDLASALVHRPTDQLVGFARALTDGMGHLSTREPQSAAFLRQVPPG